MGSLTVGHGVAVPHREAMQRDCVGARRGRRQEGPCCLESPQLAARPPRDCSHKDVPPAPSAGDDEVVVVVGDVLAGKHGNLVRRDVQRQQRRCTSHGAQEDACWLFQTVRRPSVKNQTIFALVFLTAKRPLEWSGKAS